MLHQITSVGERDLVNIILNSLTKEYPPAWLSYGLLIIT